jgi:hypothetical protein
MKKLLSSLSSPLRRFVVGDSLMTGLSLANFPDRVYNCSN